jgi:hypothetical protein
MNNNIINYQTINSNQIYLHSDNADIYYNGTKKSSVEFFLKEPLKTEKNTIECKVSVVSAQFPVSWYIINDTNNNFNITMWNYVGSISNVSYTEYNFPVGNYTASQFCKTWSQTYGSEWTLTYSSISNKITFKHATKQFAFSDNNEFTSMLPLMGFAYKNIYYSTSDTFILTPPFPVDFNMLPRINIKSNTFLLKNVDSGTKGRTRTICSVPVNAPAGGLILYNNFTSFKSILNAKSISSITIDIKDDYKNFIDFQNIDWTITLQIDIINDIISDLNDLDDVYKNLTEEQY